MDYPKSESTLKRHKYTYKGKTYKNDMGYACEYRVEENGKDTGMIVKYYGGRLLNVMGTK